MSEHNPPKKCPCCNSSKMHVTKEKIVCRACGFVNKKVRIEEVEGFK